MLQIFSSSMATCMTTEGLPCSHTEHKQLLQISKKSDGSREKWTKPDRKVTMVIMQIKIYSLQLLIQEMKLWQCYVIPKESKTYWRAVWKYLEDKNEK